MHISYNFGELLLSYARWHYGRGFNEMLVLLRNFFVFLVHFFSFKLLLKTFFSPWKRMSERYQRGLNIEAAASTFVVNFLMRIVGAISRAVILLFGTCSLILYTILAFFSSLIWLFVPFALLASFISAFFLIFASI